MAAADFDCGLRALDAGDSLVAVGLRLFQKLPTRSVARHELILAGQFEFRARGCCFRGNELRPGLDDCGFLRGNLMRHPGNGGFLGRNLLARRIDREPIVAVVNGGDDVAGVNIGVVGDRNAGEIARHLGGQRRVVSLHIGVIGRNHKPANRQIIVAEPAGRPDREDGDRAQTDAAGQRPLARLASGRRRFCRRW